MADDASGNRNATAAVIGAGDFIGAAIARRFAAEGYIVFAGRRNGDKLDAAEGARSRRRRPHRRPLARRARGGAGDRLPRRSRGRSRRWRSASSTSARTSIFRSSTPPRGCSARCGRWPASPASWPGARRRKQMLPRGTGSIFFTGATAGLRGGIGYAAFASAKFGLRAVAQAAARELGPHGIHVAHLVIDAGVDTAWVRERMRERAGDEAVDAIRPASDAPGSGRGSLPCAPPTTDRRLDLRTGNPAVRRKMVKCQRVVVAPASQAFSGAHVRPRQHPHRTRVERLATRRARRDRIEDMAAMDMLVHHRTALAPRQVHVAPVHDRQHHGIEVTPLAVSRYSYRSGFS